MRNTVILVDQIEQDVAAGHPVWAAIREAAVRRLRPIVLTAAAAVTRHDSARVQRAVGSDGICDHGRLIVVTVLTLLFVPALYAAWVGVRAPARQDKPELGPVPSASG